MKISLKEIIWFCVPAFMALLMMFLFFGTDALTTGMVDINIHDTYYVLPAYLFFVAITIVFGFFIFITRSAVFRFQNAASNILMAIYTLLLIILIIFMVTAFQK